MPMRDWLSAARARAGRLWARARAFTEDYAYLMTLGAALTVVAASALYTARVRETAQIGAAAGAPETEWTASPAPSASPTAVPLATLAPMRPAATSSYASAARPVGGKALRGFDAETPVLWEALGAYKAHPALDIAGEPGEDVLCVWDGTVAEAVRDELWDWRVTVEQTDGRAAVYAGLGGCLVQPGQNVTRAQRLGTLSDAPPCEAEWGAHLHLALLEGGEARDPETILP